QDLSFKVDSGEIVGFLGTNGAGKSTTMNMITGYISSDSGNILVGGFDILKNPKKAKAQIGYLPEVPPLYSDLTVWESLKFTYALKKVSLNKDEHLKEVADLVKIWDVKDKLISNLSKGYRQRVGIANALIGNPPILILDEPTVGLDPKQIIEIRKLIGDLAHDRTVILSSHILSEIEAVCGRIIIISNGKIVADDTPQNLINSFKKDYNLVLEVRGDKEIISKLLEIQEVKSMRFGCEKKDIHEIFVDSLDYSSASEISKVLVDNEIELLELRHNEPSLEDIFLKFTAGEGLASEEDTLNQQTAPIESPEISLAEESENNSEEGDI
ncbi:MAG: ABC transporter ATP-binding protein, partial [Oscillospiraceae bacterium]